MSSDFFAYFMRLKFINRWALMRNSFPENLSTHCAEVAVVAHALALIGNERMGKSYNADRAGMLGLFHDMPEVLTGDMPTPVKYATPALRENYAAVEKDASQRLLADLPEDLRGGYAELIDPEKDEYNVLVKAADKICALIKCIEERRAGNTEFSAAESASLEAVRALGCPEAEMFLEEFLPSCEKTLDALN
ncbi:MAG: 5'-deoxynucleotidase [Clostridia bacterium]|nr:5'-deoxynucleotidase [Clostridia bacterium]